MSMRCLSQHRRIPHLTDIIENKHDIEMNKHSEDESKIRKDVRATQSTTDRAAEDVHSQPESTKIENAIMPVDTDPDNVVQTDLFAHASPGVNFYLRLGIIGEKIIVIFIYIREC